MFLDKRTTGGWLVAVWTVASWLAYSAGAQPTSSLNDLIEAGHWQRARQEIERRLAGPDLSFAEQDALRFQRDRMGRMRRDFCKTRAQVLHEARALLPEMTEARFEEWERAGAVEFLNVDGGRWYLERAAGNLFRIQPEARALLAQRTPQPAPYPAHRLANLREILRAADQDGHRFGAPKQFKVTYTLTVKPGAVPAGETIRVWLPFPQTGGRQREVRLLEADPRLFVKPPNDRRLMSLYLEKPAEAAQPTVFKIAFEYRNRGFHQPMDPERVQPVRPDAALARHLGERPPHIVFDAPLRTLSQQIVGHETNPCRIAQRLFQWVFENVPWAGAREYSTLNSLTAYALQRRHGDCGIQTMLFMSLCRLNGIPARWESGWTTGPDQNLHDWCAIYLAPYGWVPVDVSYGLVPSEDEREKWFYLGGLDSYRLVVNTDYAQPLYPAKTHFRSEFVDFQRGEVEWRGGNLYFDQWTWDFRVEEVPESPGTGVETTPRQP